MSKADEMFLKEYGLNKIIDDEDEARYLFKNDYRQISIVFRKKIKDYSISSTSWISKDSKIWATMLEKNVFRDEFDKHCARYGHWQSDYLYFVSPELHNIISLKMQELGWL